MSLTTQCDIKFSKFRFDELFVFHHCCVFSLRGPHTHLKYTKHKVRKTRVSTDRVEQHSANVLSIAVLQAGPAELTFGPHTETTATHCLCVHSLLSALVTRAALERKALTYNEKLH